MWGPGWILFAIGPLPRGIASFAAAWLVLAASTVVALVRMAGIVLDVEFWRQLPPPGQASRFDKAGLADLLLTFVAGISILIGGFSFAYLQLAYNSPQFFTGLNHPHADVVYVTITSFTSLGSGEITPHSEVCRLLVAGQSMIGLFVISFGIAGLTNRLLSRSR